MTLKAEALEWVSASRRKRSKSAAWSAAEMAVSKAREMGLEVDESILGTGRWPELRDIEKLIKGFSDFIIVTRHEGVVEWLKAHGISGEVIDHVTDPAQVRGRRVVGTLPLNLAAEAASVTAIGFSALPAEKRGQELTVQEMDEFGARLSTYVVHKVKTTGGA